MSSVSNNNHVNAAVVSGQTGSDGRAERTAQDTAITRVAVQVFTDQHAEAAVNERPGECFAVVADAVAAYEGMPHAQEVVVQDQAARVRNVPTLTYAGIGRGLVESSRSGFIEKLFGSRRASSTRQTDSRTTGQKFKDFFRSAPVKVRVNADRMARQKLAYAIALSSDSEQRTQEKLAHKGYTYTIKPHSSFGIMGTLVLVDKEGSEAKAARQLLKNIANSTQTRGFFIAVAQRDSTSRYRVIM
ncbi:hypothetical protein COB21_02360 [Candidatus Aerophobetes bacterium]|uniref:Uncharacterized protein n=1 Tax=Aerophobetes bacterium TaxID=2030807 RepID=A0A2A4X5L5_UNCAE|nr:MAG: hypothetical protein COB21_02360 [Candidatus Aerophobetes bacterium]